MRSKNLALIFILISIVSLLVAEISSVIAQSQEDEVFFTILHTNDEHSSLIPHSSSVDYHPDFINPSKGGYARLSTIIKQIREEKSKLNEPVLLFNAGDFIGGTAFSWLIPRGYAPELLIKQKLGYDAVTIGNHEYDYGTETLTKYLIAAGYPESHKVMPVLAANTLIDESHPMHQQDLYRKYHIIHMENGLKAGLFGIIGVDAIEVASDYEPFDFQIQKDAASKAVEELKSMGADIVIALSHSGVEEDKELAKEVPGINIIIGGHCHTALHEPVLEGDTIIVQAGEYLEYLGRIELSYNKKTKKISVRNGLKPYLIRIDSSIKADPEIEQIIDYYANELNQLISNVTGNRFSDIYDIVAYSDFPLVNKPSLSETPFGNFVADAMRIVTSDKTGEKVHVAVQANGSIRGSLYPGTTEYSKGQVSFYDLTKLISLGYGKDGYAGYAIASFYLTGEELRRTLEVAALLAELKGDDYFLQFSGLKYDYNPKDVVLFEIPFIDTPLPSTMAVKNAYIYMGEGIQSDDLTGYVSLNRKDDKLYHVVSDTYILSFLPMAGDLLPQLAIVPKDKEGVPVPFEEFDRLIVYDKGKELKVWQSVVEFAYAQENIPSIYMNAMGRINPVNTMPILAWIVLALAGMIIITVLAIKQIKKRKRNKVIK